MAFGALPALADRHGVLVETLERAGSAVRPPALGTDPALERQLAELSWCGEPLFLMMAAPLAADAGFGRVLGLNRTDLALALRAWEPLADQASGIVLRAFHQAGQPVVATLIRCVQDYAAAGHSGPLDWLSALIEAETADLDTLKQIADQLPPTSLALAELTAELYQGIAARLWPMAQAEPDAFTPDLATSLGALGSILRQDERTIAAAAACFAEGIERFTPLFLRLPVAYALLMGSLAQLYLATCQQAGMEPDVDLLGSVAEVFQRLNEAGAEEH